MIIKTMMILPIISLCACTVGPIYQLPDIQTPDKWQGPHAVVQADEEVHTKWWQHFTDPVLNQLVEQALQQNLDITMAAARIRESRALVIVNQADRWPELSTQWQKTRLRNNGQGLASTQTGNHYQAGFDMRWEIDLFGRRSRAVAVASADLQVTMSEYNGVRTSVVAEVARNYLELRGAQNQEIIATKKLSIIRHQVAKSQALFKNGMIARTLVDQHKMEYARVQADIYDIQSTIDVQRQRLSTLLGDSPERLQSLLIYSDLPVYRHDVQVPLPAIVIRNRPDVRAAERFVASATEKVGIATAELYPRISLTASADYISHSGKELFKQSSQTLGVGPQLHWPIFNMGQTRALIKVTDAQLEQALLQFKQVILNALEETEVALSLQYYSQQQVKALTSSLNSAIKNTHASELRYSAGLESLLPVLEARLEQCDVEYLQSEAQLAAAVAIVRVNKAIVAQ